MAENLGAILISQNKSAQAAMLTDQAKEITIEDVENFLDGHFPEDLTLESKESIRAVAMLRYAEGDPVIPWTDSGIQSLAQQRGNFYLLGW